MSQENDMSSLANNPMFKHLLNSGQPGNPFASMSLNNDAVQQEINKQLQPLTEKLDKLTPMINQYSEQNKKVNEERSKMGALESLNLLMTAYAIASKILDGPRIEKIYHTYKEEVAAAMARGNVVAGIKQIALRELPAFAMTQEGQTIAQMAVDAFFGCREKGFKI